MSKEVSKEVSKEGRKYTCMYIIVYIHAIYYIHFDALMCSIPHVIKIALIAGYSWLLRLDYCTKYMNE